MDIEQEVAKKIFTEQADKTYIDKVLNKNDSEKINTILNKTDWTKEDIRSILYILNSTELKLGNFSDDERVIVLLHFQTLEEVGRIMETYLNFKEEINKKIAILKDTNNAIDFGDSEKELLNKILHQHLLICKGMIDTHCGIIRSAQGLGSQTFKKLTESRYEISYDQKIRQEQPQAKKGIFGI